MLAKEGIAREEVPLGGQGRDNEGELQAIIVGKEACRREEEGSFIVGKGGGHCW